MWHVTDTWPIANSAQLMMLTIHNHIMWHVTHWQQQSADDVETIHNHILWHVTHCQQLLGDDVDIPELGEEGGEAGAELLEALRLRSVDLVQGPWGWKWPR